MYINNHWPSSYGQKATSLTHSQGTKARLINDSEQFQQIPGRAGPAIPSHQFI